MTPEKRVQTSCINYLKSLKDKGHPLLIERRQAGGFSYKMGIPDVYFVYDGRHIEFEVKAPGKSLSTMQEKWRDKCKALNILWLCADDVQQLKDFMLQHFNVC